MKRNEIILRLKVFQNSEKDNPYLLRGIVANFLDNINTRVYWRHGESAKCAVRKVLEKMHAETLYQALCLDAVLHLCRDDVFRFTEWQDADLVRRINTDTYFSSLRPEQWVGETQEGVV